MFWNHKVRGHATLRDYSRKERALSLHGLGLHLSGDLQTLSGVGDPNR